MSENKEKNIEEKDDKAKAKDELNKEMKELGIVGVVFDEKNGNVIGITEAGKPKIIDRSAALFLMKNLNIVSPNGNNYAIGDKNKEAGSVAEVDTTKVREAQEASENVERTKEAMERVEKAKSRSEELKRRPDAFEMALNRVLGKKPKDTNKEILSGSLSEDLKLISTTIAKRYLKNVGKTTAQTVEQNVSKVAKSFRGYP